MKYSQTRVRGPHPNSNHLSTTALICRSHFGFLPYKWHPNINHLSTTATFWGPQARVIIVHRFDWIKKKFFRTWYIIYNLFFFLYSVINLNFNIKRTSKNWCFCRGPDSGFKLIPLLWSLPTTDWRLLVEDDDGLPSILKRINSFFRLQYFAFYRRK